MAAAWRLGAVLAFGLAASAAAADVPGVPYFGCGGAAWYDYGARSERVPYFSLYPPVYYSCPIPRTYGYSPYAYPPGTMTPELVVEPTPKVLQNRFLPRKSSPPDSRTAGGPLVLRNPFVAQPEPPTPDSQLAEADRR